MTGQILMPKLGLTMTEVLARPADLLAE